jgi:hypothetical protein
MINQMKDEKITDSDNKDLILQLEKQVAVGVWIKVIGQIIEITSLSKLILISEELRSDFNERQIVQGVWIQTIGQLLEGIGVTKQILASDEALQLEGRKVTVIGDWLQALGITVEANAGTKIVVEEQGEFIP